MCNRLVFVCWFCVRGWAAVGVGAFLTGCGPMMFVVGMSPSHQQLEMKVVEPSGRWFSPRVAIIDVTGMIHNANKRSLFGHGDNPVSLLYEKLEKARQDPAVKAVILRLNTPGGTVTASDTMYRIVERFKRRSHKPVIAMMMDVAASGGYYLACGADTIVAYPTTITGSIGVILQTISFKVALSRLGIQAESITTGPNKDAGSPLSTLTEENRAVLKTLVDNFYQGFLEVVRRARPNIPADQFSKVTDGRVITGADAARLGLVDRVGDLYLAFDLAKEQAGIQHADLVVYHRSLEYVGSPYAASPFGKNTLSSGSASTQINLMQFNFADTLAQPPLGFYYLWQPDLP